MYSMRLYVLLVCTLAFTNALRVSDQTEYLDDAVRAESKHRCIHDSLIDKTPRQVVPHVRHSNEILINGKRGAIPPEPIRVVFNTDYLDASNDPLYVCTAVGQWRKQGNPPGTEANHSPQDECPSGGCSSDTCSCWYQCAQEDILTQSKIDFIMDTVIPDVKEYFASALNLYRVQGNLVLNRTNACNCGGTGTVLVPNSYTTTGIPNADIVIFLTARSTRMIGSTIAYACGCAFADSNNRAVGGHINWGPNQIDLTPLAYPEQLGVGIHELTHVLGFSKGSYSSFPVTDVTIDVTYTDNSLPSGQNTHQVTGIASPKVLEKARAHFNCPDMTAVELENGGLGGTAGSHWERRLFMNEYMTGFSSYDPVYSEMTLALLEDSGWYFPNYSAAGDLKWGKGAGCDFVKKRCTARQPPYNCNPVLYDGNDEGCTWDGLKKGRCNIESYESDLSPLWYQYYNSYPNGAKLGGSDAFADYCGFYRYVSSYRGDCTVSEYNNLGPANSYFFTAQGEHYCPSCRCVSATALEFVSGSETEIVGPSCQNFTCVNNQLKMKIGVQWHDCTSNSKKLQPTGYEGSWSCPSDVAAVCAKSPVYTSWPGFVSVSPDILDVGDEVTVVGNGFGTATVTNVYFGKDHGCASGTMQVSTSNGEVQVVCKLGRKEGAFKTRRDTDVDVVMEDSYGRTAVGVASVTLNNAISIVYSPITILFLVVIALFAM